MVRAESRAGISGLSGVSPPDLIWEGKVFFCPLWSSNWEHANKTDKKIHKRKETESHIHRSLQKTVTLRGIRIWG